MKKLLIIMATVLFCSSIAYAEEEMTNQTVVNQNSYLGINIEKKPIQETGKQAIKNEKSFLFVNIIINGKYPYEKETK